MSETHETTQTARPRRHWRREYWLAGLALATLAAVAVAVPAAMASRGFPGGGHGPGHGLLQDPDQARARAGAAAEWVLRAVDGTEAQKEQARQVTDRLVDDLLPIASRHQDLRGAMARELAGADVDRAALEQLRQKEVALADDASRVVVTAAGDLAEILTPAQRRDLVALLQRFHGETVSAP